MTGIQENGAQPAEWAASRRKWWKAAGLGIFTSMKDRTLLMIPGPIEVEPAVLQAMGAPTASHVAADFIDVFGRALEGMREVWRAPTGQPFILAGSGTMEIDGEQQTVSPGDGIIIPAGAWHQITAASGELRGHGVRGRAALPSSHGLAHRKDPATAWPPAIPVYTDGPGSKKEPLWTPLR